MIPATSDAQLAVSWTTDPERFTVSTLTETKLGTLFVTVAKPPDAPDVACRGIRVTLPAGEEDSDLVMSGKSELIDDYPRDTAAGQWGVVREPPAPTGSAPGWGSAPDHGLENIFDPSDDTYYQTPGKIYKDSALTVDYGAVQQIRTIEIATGFTDARFKVPPLEVQVSPDGKHYRTLQICMDTSQIDIPCEPPAEAQYVRIYLLYDLPEMFAVIRRFLINQDKADRAAQTSTVTFNCTPPGGETVFDDNRKLTLILSRIPVNRAPGRTGFEVTETTAVSGQWREYTTTVTGIEKADNEFVFANFSSTKPGVGHGEHTELRWTGSLENTEYHLSWDDQSEILEVPPSSDCRHPTPDLFHTTTFVLDAQTRNMAGETIHHYRSATVAVADPDIRARTLTAAEHLAVADETGQTFRADSQDHSVAAGPAEFHGDVTIT